MTCIAWDGTTLAADKQSGNNGNKRKCTKIWQRPDGIVIAITGDMEYGFAMKNWYETGADPTRLPPFQGTDSWMRLIVARGPGECFVYEKWGYAIPVEGAYDSWGTGRDYALGAFHMGATAIQAVVAASAHCDSCGFGVDAFDAGVIIQDRTPKPAPCLVSSPAHPSAFPSSAYASPSPQPREWPLLCGYPGYAR